MLLFTVFIQLNIFWDVDKTFEDVTIDLAGESIMKIMTSCDSISAPEFIRKRNTRKETKAKIKLLFFGRLCETSCETRSDMQ